LYTFKMPTKFATLKRSTGKKAVHMRMRNIREKTILKFK